MNIFYKLQVKEFLYANIDSMYFLCIFFMCKHLTESCVNKKIPIYSNKLSCMMSHRQHITTVKYY